MTVLSFHPCFEANINIICAGRSPNKSDLEAITKSRAVVLSQGCTEALYRMVRSNCLNVFPNFDSRFSFFGKVGQVELFKLKKTPHPKSLSYYSVKDFFKKNITPKIPKEFSLPFVFKFNWGGEGNTVFIVKTKKMFNQLIDLAIIYEKNGHCGFLIQQYVESIPRILRVVIIGSKIVSYWKIQSEENILGKNSITTSSIDKKVDVFFLEPAIKIVKQFCSNTGINLAGFDLIFSKKNLLPQMLEINYFFGRRGLGGSEQYYKLLTAEIKKWIEKIPVPKNEKF